MPPTLHKTTLSCSLKSAIHAINHRKVKGRKCLQEVHVHIFSLVHSVQWLKPIYDVCTKIQGKGLVTLLVSPCSSAGEGCSYNQPLMLDQINLMLHRLVQTYFLVRTNTIAVTGVHIICVTDPPGFGTKPPTFLSCFC